MKILAYWRYFAAALAGAVLVILTQWFWPHTESASSPEAAHAHEEHAEEAGHEHKEGETEKAGDAHEHGEGEEGHGGEAHAVKLTEAQLKASGITLQTASQAPLAAVLRLPGQLVLNADREARVLSPITGMVREVRAQTGERVNAGAVLAVIESQELAEANANYLAARERRALAESTFTREETLWQKKISAEQDYLQARKDLAEARIEERSTLQKLLALGVSEGDAKSLKGNSALARYSLRAPIAGSVLERTLTVGEAVSDDKPLFRLADLSSLWIDLSVPVSELAAIKRGQRVVVKDKTGVVSGEGKVLFVQPELSAESRTGSVRVALDNAQGQWLPGMFVTTELVTGQQSQVLSIPEGALQTLEGKTVVFVADADGLEPREITLGRRSAGRVEVLAGLKTGERFAATGSFVLKAELQKGEAEHEH